MDGDEPDVIGGDERTPALLCHVAAFAGFVIPLGNILGPLLVWLARRDRSTFVDDHGREAVNFQISVTLYGIAIALATVIAVLSIAFDPDGAVPSIALLVLAVPLMLALVVLDLVAVIVGMVRAANGEWYRYPLNIRLVR